jgi:hypothetical protein
MRRREFGNDPRATRLRPFFSRHGCHHLRRAKQGGRGLRHQWAYQHGPVRQRCRSGRLCLCRHGLDFARDICRLTHRSAAGRAKRTPRRTILNHMRALLRRRGGDVVLSPLRRTDPGTRRRARGQQSNNAHSTARRCATRGHDEARWLYFGSPSDCFEVCSLGDNESMGELLHLLTFLGGGAI